MDRTLTSFPTKALGLCLCFGLIGAACTTENFGVVPRQQEFHYPIAGSISPDGNYLYVVNSDFNLEFNGALVNVLDLRKARMMADAAQTNPSAPTLVNEREFIGTAMGDSARINPFATAALVRTTQNGARSRLYITVRGDGSLTWIDLKDNYSHLECGQTSPDGLCASEHRVGQKVDPQVEGNVTLPPLPVNLSVSNDGYIAVAHQESPSARVSLFYEDPAQTDAAPRMVFWAGGFSPGLSAIVRVNDSAPNTFPHWFAFSRYEPFTNHVRAVPNGLQSYLYRGEATPLAGVSADLGVRAFVADPCQPKYGYATARPRAGAVVGSRSGDSLLRIDLTDPNLPVVTETLELPPGPSNLAVTTPNGCSGHVYVHTVSYDARAMYTVDVTDWQLVGRVRTSLGPHVPIADPNPMQEANRNLIYLIDFAAMVVEIIDVSNPRAPRVLFTIGDVVLPMVSM